MTVHAEQLWNDLHTLWGIFALYFLTTIGKIHKKRSLSAARFGLESCSIVIATLLIFFTGTHKSFLAVRFSSSSLLQISGFCLTVLGLAFASWARAILGKNWSARPLIQIDHRLITRGPYAYLRHPLYTGLLVALAGTVLVCGDFGAILGWIVAVAYFRAKAWREEYLLQSEFGPHYLEYRSRTGFLLPRISHV